MAFSDPIVVDTKSFDLITTRPTSSVRSNPAMDIADTELLTISHEIQKNQKLNSVIIFDKSIAQSCDSQLCGLGTTSNVRVQMKLSYQLNAEITKSEITAVLVDLLNFIEDTPRLEKFLNRES